jgi:hypothetical protein
MINNRFIVSGIFILTAIGVHGLNAGDSEEVVKPTKGEAVKFTVPGLRALEEARNTEVPETPVKLFDFTMPNSSSKEFKIDETYLNKPTKKFEERGPKATKGLDWSIELNNKNNDDCFFTIESFYPRYEPLVQQEEIKGEEKIRFLLQKYGSQTTLLHGYYIIKIWRANTTRDGQPDIVKVVTAENATAFLNLDGDELLPQKGVRGSTQSGLRLKKNNVQIYSEMMLDRVSEFNMELKRSKDEKAAIEQYLKLIEQSFSESSSSKDSKKSFSSSKKKKKRSSSSSSEEKTLRIFDGNSE